jgi:two-component system chemotaxis response regulator CheY
MFGGSSGQAYNGDMKLKVLIADDAPFIREIIRNILEEEAVDILPDACDGQEVIRIAQELHPHIIFMDLVMPHKNGIDATEEILSKQPNVKIIAISSMHSPDLVQKALQAGCVDFINKPFQLEEIQNIIRQMIRPKNEVANG